MSVCSKWREHGRLLPHTRLRITQQTIYYLNIIVIILTASCLWFANLSKNTLDFSSLLLKES